ncbi:MAG: hypothetical protein H6740_23385 [Alphaproteobacteria bacterium]|nr:hypothetical protein [Alphaproteobacteria bacterium]
MQNIRFNLRFIGAALLLTGAVACGGKLEPGYTDCGPTTCSPGQYCAFEGVCENGCTSDANCLPGTECVITDDFFNEGECYGNSVDTGRPDDTPSGGDPLADCQAACDHFQTCGLGAADASQCRSDCNGLTEDQQIAIGNCEGLTCGATLSCLGVDCFSDSDCGGGQVCLDYTCL